MGLKCYIHKDTLEVISFPDEDDLAGTDEDIWKGEVDKVTEDPQKHIVIVRMDFREDFKWMEEFIYSLGNDSIKRRLLEAIEGRKPFATFRREIDSSDEYRDMWFSFRRNKIIEQLPDQLDADF